MTDPFVIVGGDATGLSAASKAKRDDPDRDVVVFERGNWVSYAHCGTPYFVNGTVETLPELLSLTPDAIAERGIDLRRNHEVVAIDTDARTVTVANEGEERVQPYGAVLIATGARADATPVAGTDLDGVFTLHGLDDAAAIRAFLSDPDEFRLDAFGDEAFLDVDRVTRYGAMTPPETVAVVGGGYVGIEMTEAFTAWGLDVHVFQRSPHVLGPFGDAVAERVEEHLEEQGVTRHLGTPVEALAGDGHVDRVVCRDGSELAVDAVLVGVGIQPNVSLATETGIDLGVSGAIAVDAYGRTSAPDVYAAGDCAETQHVVTGEDAWVPLGLTANRAGRAIGQTVTGTPTVVGGVAGTAVVKAFDLEAGRSGLTESAARDAGFDPVAATITAGSRSGYYPGGDDTTVTLVADRETNRLLGGSIVGTDRAAIRIDTVATALEAELTIPEVERLDLAYAPPFSPVWDPVLVAAKVLNGRLGA